MIADYLIPSPLGEIALREEDGYLTGVFFVGQKYFPPLAFAQPGSSVPDVIRDARNQLMAFFAGERRVFTVPVRLRGTAFQRRVWRELALIPYGTVLSYGALAKRMGLGSGHARAVGSANGRNPVSIIVPCHRVLGDSGELTGYAGGLERKQALLLLENALAVSGQDDLFN